MQPSTRVSATALAVKQAVVDYYEAGGYDLPSRRLVTPGLPAFDCCEMLAVQVERVFQHQGEVAQEVLQSIGAAAAATVRGASFAVWILRSVPVMKESGRMRVAPPSADDEEAAAMRILADQQLVWNALIEAQRAGTLATCDSMAMDAWTYVGPSGGIGGGVQRVRLSLVMLGS